MKNKVKIEKLKSEITKLKSDIATLQGANKQMYAKIKVMQQSGCYDQLLANIKVNEEWINNKIEAIENKEKQIEDIDPFNLYV